MLAANAKRRNGISLTLHLNDRSLDGLFGLPAQLWLHGWRQGFSASSATVGGGRLLA